VDIYRDIARLNPRQKEAVMHSEGPLLILAGAGSGKTRVITTRTAHLIEKGIKPSSILAVTFTNKAAREMKRRVSSMVKKGKGRPIISTFHSLCLRILRREIEPLGYKKDFTIYSTSEQVSLMRNILSEVKFYDKSFKPEAVLEKISMTKNDFSPSEPVDEDDPVEIASELLYPKYREALKTMNALDFDDLLLLTLQLFRENPLVLEKYRKLYKYIMVDEYQDTNRIQYDLIKLLAGERGNLCVVGDDDQSIYGWRGADIGNILNFEKDFPGTLTVRLEQNYRSFDNILKAANGVIKNNKERMEKSLWTDLGEGPKVNIFKAVDTDDEAEWVAGRIAMLKEAKNVAYEKVAIIYRANIFSKHFEEALRMQQIPYTVVGGTSYFERKEVMDISAWLKIIANPSDGMSLMRAVNAPKRGLGPSALGKLSEFAQSSSIDLLEALGRAKEVEGLKPGAAASAEEMHRIVSYYRERFLTGRKMDRTLTDLIEEINYKDYIIKLYKTPEAAYRRIENLDAFVESINHYESVERDPSIQGFLETMALTDLIKDKDEKVSSGVTLISFHSSKGLEFPVVFIAGTEEEILPHRKSIDADGGIEEERRLFYVGITRAMKELFITYTGHRKKYGKEVPSVPSRFLYEIPENVSQEVERFEKMEPEEEEAYVKNLYDNFMAKMKD
jgi:superfamily I DNA/RNA helicase